MPLIVLLREKPAMRRPESPSDIPTKPRRKKTSVPFKDRASTKLLRLILTAALAIILAVVFIKIVIPANDAGTPPPNTSGYVTPGRTAEGRVQAPEPSDAETPIGEGETAAIYRGQGGEPADNPRITWDITLDISARTLRLLEGSVVTRKSAGEPPTSDFSFSITPNSYMMKLSESGTAAVSLGGAYEPSAAAPFSIDDKNQFFIYLTPKKLSLPSGAVAPRFLTQRENSALISMQGFIRADNRVFGTFHSTFGPDIEYVLEPVTTQ
jgi:hypothetical protein